MPALTVGMATYDDFHGVYFTLQALRLYQDLTDTELLVVDNFGCEHTAAFVEGLPGARYVRATEAVGTAAPRDRVFRDAHGEAVLCMDSHVLLAPGSVARLREYYREHPGSPDLVQGPLLDDGFGVSTHFEPVWREQMWGTWATDPRGEDPEGEPFEIPMQGLGVFSCRTAAWPGFNAGFRGFGGEEGYLHEKVRQRGGRCLCLPWLRWVHRFVRPAGAPYPLTVEDKLRNYVIGHAELGLDLTPVLAHFREHLPEDRVVAVAAEALWGPGALQPPSPTEREAAGEAGVARASRSSGSPSTGQEEYPAVSCLCPTYGRVALLEEAVECFLRQDYPGEKELVVLNDLDRQRLVFDHPEVTVVNLPRRLRTLGEKHDAVVALAAHDLLFVWDDDDVYLPHRLRFSVERYDERKGFFKPRTAWFWNRGELSGPEENLFFAASCWSRELFERVRGYAPVDLGYDAELEARFAQAQAGSTAPHDVSPDEIYYVYRWDGTGTYHGSGFAQDHYRAVEAIVHEQVERGLVPTGEVVLTPHWKVDYTALVREHLAGSVGRQPSSALADGGTARREPRRDRPAARQALSAEP